MPVRLAAPSVPQNRQPLTPSSTHLPTVTPQATATTPPAAEAQPAATPPRTQAPDKASATLPVVPTDSVMHPLSIGDYELKKLDAMEDAKSFEKRVDLKVVGDPKANHLALLQAKTSGKAFYEKGPKHREAQGKSEAGLKVASGTYTLDHEGRFGSTHAYAGFDVGTRIKGEAAAKLSKEDLALVGHAKAEGMAGVSADFSVEQKHGKHFGESIDGNVLLGARALGVATLAIDKKEGTAMAKVGYYAIAGARESVHGEVKVGVLRVSAGIAAVQGVHSAALFGAGVKDGRLMLTADLGAALGVGATVRVGVSVNGRAVANNARAAGHVVKEKAHTVGQAMKEQAHTVKEKSRRTGHKAWDSAHSMGHAMKEKATHVGHKTKDGWHSLRRSPEKEPVPA
ncbi:MAG: hypothetical protein ABW123_14280 [Cystobacter sp.]